MSESSEDKKSRFQKVGECLYRYSSSRVYYARLQVNGKEIWCSLKTNDPALAKRKLSDKREELERVDPKLGKMTVEALLKKYELAQRTLDASTQVTRAGIVRIFTRTWKKGVTCAVRDVKPSDLQEWLGQHRERVSKATLNEYLRFLRQAFQIAVQDGVIFHSPVQGIKEFKRDKPIRLTPNFTQFQKIVADIRAQNLNADSKDSGDFVEFLGLSGLGNSEAAALTWRDIDFRRKKIRTYRNKTDEGFEIPIFPRLMKFLKKLEKEQKPNPSDKVLKISDAKNSLAGACNRLKLPKYTHRALRRMFVTRCIEKNIDFKTIASWQGHRDGGVLVAKTYSHLRTEHSDLMAIRLA